MVSVVPVTALIVFYFIADNYFNSDCIVICYSYFSLFTFYFFYSHLSPPTNNIKKFKTKIKFKSEIKFNFEFKMKMKTRIKRQ